MASFYNAHGIALGPTWEQAGAPAFLPWEVSHRRKPENISRRQTLAATQKTHKRLNCRRKYDRFESLSALNL